MKKIITPCLIACALTISTNSFGMLRLTRTAHITHTKKVFLQQRKFHTTPLVYRSKQHKIAEQNNLLLQKISAQLDIIQKQLDNSILQHKEKETNDKDGNRDNPFDQLRDEKERDLKRHREHGGFDSSNPSPYRDYDDYVKYHSY